MNVVDKNDWITQETKYHDAVATDYARKTEWELIWQIPERKHLYGLVDFRRKRILDFGCGPATAIAQVLSESAYSLYVGVDISLNMLHIAQGKLKRSMLVCGDIDEISFKKGFFDVVTCLSVQHHLPEPYQTLSRLLTLAKDDALLLMREPSIRGLKPGEGESPNERGLEEEKLIEVLKSNGFNIEHVQFINSKVVNKARRAAQLIGLRFLEKKTSCMTAKLVIDEYLDKLLGTKLPSLFKGADMLLSAKRSSGYPMANEEQSYQFEDFIDCRLGKSRVADNILVWSSN